ncbi:hypothetical protein LHJ74_20180 [Streptomyces sp. N2-109]|uniref:ATP-binding protein n=1 Tax=Streptomyces gossypii TaxID=2883101 RepID=A0ABT2JWB3_9ACTN|nr:hypothetical protein [Streptomyces gossypii]MCT2592193.1 hypothetical protein [Streptomyces gossypii]
MSDDLGLQKLLDDEGFVARILGRTRSGRNRKVLYGPDLPVVLLSGGPGMGKGRLLRCIRSEFGPHVPTAHVDCASARYRDEADQHAETRSEITEVLRGTAAQLGAWEGHGGAISTPRLYAGLAAVAASGRRASTAALVGEVRRHDDLMPSGSFWGGLLNRAARNYAGALAAFVTGPLTAPLITLLVEELLARLSKDGGAALAACYGEYSGAGGQPRQGLLSLGSDFQQGGEPRRYAESFLFRALRDDIEGAYGALGGRMRRVGRPALLLDHADTALGRRLVKPVLEDRETGHHDRLVIFATARRTDGGRFLYRAGDTARDSPGRWLPSEGGLPLWSRPPGGVPGLASPSRGVLLVRMPVLTRDQQEEQTSRLQVRRPDEHASLLPLHGAIRRLTGGRPLSVTRLAEATSLLDSPEGRTAWDLLDVPLSTGDATPGRPVAEILLDALVVRQLPEELPPQQRAHWLDLLTHLSVAHDAECAQSLMRARQAGRDGGLSAYRIAELLEDSGWPHCPRHFIGDLGLRHLLLRRLHHLQPGGAALREDHTLVQDDCRALGDGRPDALFGTVAAHRMHHHLASDGAESVADYLTQSLSTRNTREWCEELLAIAGAPLLGGLGGTDDRRARALGEAPEVAGDARRRLVDRLLHAVWLCEDPTQPPDDAVNGVLKSALDWLSVDAPHGAEVLAHRARDWSGLADSRQPLQPCACTNHIG